MKGHDAECEMRHRKLRELRVAVLRDELDIARMDAAAPGRGKRTGREHLPAVRVGDVERQAAVGMIVGNSVHPAARRRRRSKDGWVRLERVTGQFHIRTSASER